jgi:TRAP-type transport system periplasmic protein
MKSGFILTLSAALVSGLLIGSADARTLRFGHSATETNPRHEAALFFAKRVAELTGGKLTVTVAANAQYGDDIEMITGLRLGTIDLSISSQGGLSGIVPEAATIGLPFLFDSVEKAWKVLDGPVGTDLAARASAKGVELLAYWDNGIRHITNNVRPIKTPEDLKGLKLRVPPDPMASDIFTALGANPTAIKFSELYLALQQKVVDGQENPVVNIYSQKFHEVQKYMTLSRHKYEILPFLASKQMWASLSAAEKDAVRKAAAESRDFQRDINTKGEVKDFEGIKKAGVEIFDADPAPFRAATKSVYDKWAAQYPDFVAKIVAASKQ